MPQGPLAAAWGRYLQLVKNDGRIEVSDLDLETWRLMFMEGAHVALVNSKDSESKTMLLTEVLVFELERMKRAGKSPALVVIDGGKDADGPENHDRPTTARPLSS
jgi:hypothetical protein